MWLINKEKACIFTKFKESIHGSLNNSNSTRCDGDTNKYMSKQERYEDKNQSKRKSKKRKKDNKNINVSFQELTYNTQHVNTNITHENIRLNNMHQYASSNHIPVEEDTPYYENPQSIEATPENKVVTPFELEAQIAKRRKIEMEDEEEGLTEHHNYRCEICRLGDMTFSQTIVAQLENIYISMRTLYNTISKENLYQRISSYFNNMIFHPNRHLFAVDESLKIKPWTPAMVRYHYLHCRPLGSVHDVEDNIEFLSDLQHYIQTSGMFVREYDQETNSTKESINELYMKYWLDSSKRMSELIKLHSSLVKQLHGKNESQEEARQVNISIQPSMRVMGKSRFQ